MKLPRRQFLRLAAGAATVPVVSRITWAQTYPSRPVRVIVASAAAGPPDTITRIVMQKLSESSRQQFFVENIPTGAGNVGAATAAKAPADGYTILAPTSSIIINPSLYAKLAYDPLRDFAPVTMLAVSPQVIVVHPSLPVTNPQELVALVKANPGKFSYASPGTGTTGDLAAELFRLSLGLDLVRVPFNGGAPAITSTVGGHTPIALVALPPAAIHIKDGRLRALALTSSRRSPEFPEIPTLAEAGIPDQESLFIQCLLVPARTPREVIDYLYRQIARIMALPDVQQRLASIGFEPVVNRPEEFAVQLKSEIARWARVIRDANIRKIE